MPKLLRLCVMRIGILLRRIGILLLSAIFGAFVGNLLFMLVASIYVTSGSMIGADLDHSVKFENHQDWFKNIGAVLGILISLIWFYREYTENKIN